MDKSGDYVAIQRIPVVNVLTRNTIYNWTNARQIISQRKQLGGQNQEYHYVWLVKAQDAISKEPIGKRTGIYLGYSDFRHFVIKPPTPWSEPQISSPIRLSINEANAVNPINFRWQRAIYNRQVEYVFQIFETQLLNSAPSHGIFNSKKPVVEFVTKNTFYGWKNASAIIAKSKQNYKLKFYETTYKYVWRVRARDAMTKMPIGKNTGLNLGYSNIGFISVTPIKIKEYKAPQQVLPGLNYTAKEEDVYNEGIRFSWHPVTPVYTQGVNYKFEIFELPSSGSFDQIDESKPLFSYSSDKTNYVWNDSLQLIKEAKTNKKQDLYSYVWRVQAFDSKTGKPIGANSASALMRFNINPSIAYSEPTLLTPANVMQYKESEVRANGITFSWNTVKPDYPSAITYELQIFDLPSGTNIKDAVLASPILSYSLQDIELQWNDISKLLAQSKIKYSQSTYSYVWRVKATDAKTGSLIGSKIGAEKGFSELRYFIVSPAPRYAESEIRNPDDQSEFYRSALNQTLGITVTWNSVKDYPGNVEYLLEVFEKAPGKNAAEACEGVPLISFVSNNTTYYLKGQDFIQKSIDKFGNIAHEFVIRVKSQDAQSKAPIGKKAETLNGYSELLTVKIIPDEFIESEFIYPTDATSFQESKAFASENGMFFQWSTVKGYPGKLKYQLEVYEVFPNETPKNAIARAPVLQVVTENNNYGWSGQQVFDALKSKYKAYPDWNKIFYRFACRVKVMDANTEEVLGVKDGIEQGYSKLTTISIRKEDFEPKLVLPVHNQKIPEADLKDFKFTWFGDYKYDLSYKVEIYEKAKWQSVQDALLNNKPTDSSIVYKNQEFKWANIRKALFNSTKNFEGQTDYEYIWRIRLLSEGYLPGQYFPIGVKAGDQKGYTDVRVFTIQPDKRNAQNTYPEDNKEIYPNSKTDLNYSITFKWTAGGQPIDTESSFTYNLELYRMESTGNYAFFGTYPNLNSDQYQLNFTKDQCNKNFKWRIARSGGGLPVVYTDWSYFITRPVLVIYSEPVLVFPIKTKPTQSYTFYDKQISWDSASAGIQFQWGKVTPSYSGTVNYRIYVYKFSNSNKTEKTLLFSALIQDDSVFRWKYTEKNFDPNYYEWFVEARDKNTGELIGKKSGEQKGLSNSEKFQVNGVRPKKPELNFPSSGSELTNVDFKKGVEFRWKPIDPMLEGVSYKIQLYQTRKIDGETTIIYDSTLNGQTSCIISRELSDNFDYKWRIQASVQGLGIIGREVVNGSLDEGWTAFSIFKLSMKPEVYQTIELEDCDGNKRRIMNKGMQKNDDDITDLRNKFVKIGGFSMLITESTGSANSLSGKGSIFVTWLKSAIAVEFSGISVNISTMEVTNGEVFAMQDETGSDLPKFLKASSGRKVSKNDAVQLNNNLKKNKDKKMLANQNMDANLDNLAGENLSKLPLGLNNALGYTVAISEMKFSSTKNVLVGVAVMPFNRDGQEDVLAFAATDIQFSNATPATGGGQLVLIEDFHIVNPDNNNYGITLVAFDGSSAATYMAWGCKGFENLQTTVDVAFPRDWLTPVKEEAEPLPDEKVVARAKANITNLNDWILSASLSPCEINGLDGVELEVNELVLDNSDSRNIQDMEFPKGYIGDKRESFKGFFLRNANLNLPKFHNKKTDTTGLSVQLDNFIITKAGISGNIKVGDEKNPILNLESGTVGDFQASIESLEIEIVSKSLKKAAVNGKLVLPICKSSASDNNALAYEASWTSSSKKKGVCTQISIKPDGALNTDLIGGAVLNLDESSTIELVYEMPKKRKAKGKTTASVELNGDVSLNKKLMDKIQLELSMNFQKLGFSYDNSKSKGKMAFNKGATFSFASPQKKVSGFPFTISDISIEDAETGAEEYEVAVALSMNVKVNLGTDISGSTRLKLIGGIKKENNLYQPAFIDARIDSVAISAKLSAVDLNGIIVFYHDDYTYGNGFYGLASAQFQKMGQVTASVRFGSVKNNSGFGTYRYWYVDGLLMLKKATPMIGTLGFKGAGLGAWYNMEASTVSMNADEVYDASADVTQGSSGAVFTPTERKVFGFRITGIFSNISSDKTFNGDLSFEASFNGSGGIDFLAVKGNAFAGAGINERAEAPIMGALEAKYDFTKDIFDLNVKVSFSYPPKAPIISTKQPATFQLHVEKSSWFLYIGTPETPNEITYLSLDSWCYFRAGNQLVTNSSFNSRTIAGLAALNLNLVPTPEPVDENVKGGKGFDFGIGMSQSGKVSVGPFYGSYSVGAEVNLSIAQYDATNGCVTDKFNYWYARGGIAAWASGKIGFKGLIEAQLKGAAVMQAGAPDPVWIKGRIAGQFGLKIIFITINIKASVPFTYGEVCRPRRPSLGAENGISMDNLDDIEMNELVEIADLAVHSSGNVDRMTAIPILSMFGCSYEGDGSYYKTTEIKTVENGDTVRKVYSVFIEWFVDGWIINNPGATATYPGSPKFSHSNQWNMGQYNGIMGSEDGGYALGTFWYQGTARNKRFAYDNDYKTWVRATLKVKNAAGDWEIAKNSKGEAITMETRKVSFRTHK